MKINSTIENVNNKNTRKTIKTEQKENKMKTSKLSHRLAATVTMFGLFIATTINTDQACSRALYHSDILNSTQIVRTVDWEGFDKG